MPRSFTHRNFPLEGFLLALSPSPFLLLDAGTAAWHPWLPWGLAALVAGAWGLYGQVFGGREPVRKSLALAGALGCLVLLVPQLSENPFATFLVLLSGIYFGFTLFDSSASTATPRRLRLGWPLQKAQGAAWGLVVLALAILILGAPALSRWMLLVAVGAAAVLWWSVGQETGTGRRLWAPSALVLAGGALAWWTPELMPFWVLSAGAGLVWHLGRRSALVLGHRFWWEDWVANPAQILPISFLLLCLLGTLLLNLPLATVLGEISFLDAAFTAVSAVCVTGLIVLDTPKDFSLWGQVFIMLLIQLGGLGIMSITTVALHALGQRLSLKHERLITAVTETNRADLLASLKVILKFTAFAEILGFLVLSALLLGEGYSWGQALWIGLFTSISAFCNAGFALFSDSLISLQGSPAVLHTVALLIIAGGLAPATCLVLPRWLAGKRIPLGMRIPLAVNAFLLVAGWGGLLALEWNGLFNGLSVVDKVHNAWFQSVTLRTAGFNSVDLVGSSSAAYLGMLLMMFVGGSPGGTAGGIKTTTVGVLALVFWTTVRGRQRILLQNREILPVLVYRAVAILMAFGLVWMITVALLQVTQQHISAKALIFEASSALGTVGLSIGATGLLDELGKMVVMVAMFAGRVGPMTLFMLLSSDTTASNTRYNPINLSLS